MSDGDVTLADEQGLEVAVIGEAGDERTTADDSVTVTSVGDDRIVFEVNDTAFSSDPVAVEIRDLRFDAAATETVALDAGESETVATTVSFETAGEQEISVGGVTLGTVVVGDDDSENETSDDGPNVEPPAGAVAFDARGIDDVAPDEAGVAVDFENVTVERITFVEGADGQVAITEMDE
ncbi:MAG: hypothetical protein V5A53_13750, partial [Natronomonas sp.]